MASPAPLWLAAPSRYAQLRRPQVRLALFGLALLLLGCLLALAVPDPPALTAESVAGAPSSQTDLALYEKIVAGVKGGENYYTAAADALRAGSYPLRPFLTFRMPGLAVLLAALPEGTPRYLLLALAIATGIAWGVRLREALPRTVPWLFALVLLLASLLAFLQPGLVAFHEIWAGLLVALSLALRRPGRWVEAVAIALAAMLIRETAALYALVMAGFAWREGARREAIGWAVAIGLFAVMLAAHAWAVTGVTGPLDPASPGWAGLRGPGLFVKALVLATALQLLPLWGGALITGLAIFGWSAWDDPLAARVVAVLLAYGAAIALFARLDTFYWGLMVAPLLLAGIAFAPDGLVDLFRRAVAPGKPRVTVTRVTR